ncbi:DUF5360 family protein [Cardiobacterium valvarum]|nr:DUF5360 family protein [Cardiobacterium valvarum]
MPEYKKRSMFSAYYIKITKILLILTGISPVAYWLAITTLSRIALIQYQYQYKIGEILLTAGFTLTFTAGFMAISFWANYGNCDSAWWLPNIALLAFSFAIFIPQIYTAIS